MSSLRRHRIPSRQTAGATGPQNLSATLQGMQRQGANLKDKQVRRHVRNIVVPGYLPSLEIANAPLRFLMLKTATGFLIHQALFATTISQQLLIGH